MAGNTTLYRSEFIVQPIKRTRATDKIFLPQSVLGKLLDQIETLPSPLIFRLTNPGTGNYTHVGIREFSANEGVAIIPHTISKLLDATADDTVVAELVELPKGSRLRLKPIHGNYDVDDWKSMLESQLNTTHTALTKGNILTVTDPLRPEEDFEFTIEEVEPEDAVCIVDTDIELEIDEPAALTSNQPSSGSSSSSLQIGKPMTINTNNGPDGSVKLELNSWNRLTPLEIDLQYEEDEGDSSVAFIGVDSNTNTENFIWSTLYGPVTIDPKSPYLSSANDDSTTLFITVQSSSSSSSPPILTASIQNGTSEQQHTLNDNNNDEHAEDEYTLCGNCKQYIPNQSMMIHSAFCLRNNVRCECGKIFQKKISETHWHCLDHNVKGENRFSKETHFKYLHESITCVEGYDDQEDPVFANRVEKALHKATECPLSLHICRFCHLRLPRGKSSAIEVLYGLSAHEAECGNKTTECYLCGKTVRRKELDSHLQYHNMDRLSRSAPVVCSNRNCARVVDNSNNDLGLCGFCFGPLHSTAYDPSGSRLKSRVERRYVIQLTRGCGNTSCMNPQCRMNRPQLNGMGEVMKVVTELLTLAMENKEFYFCVDEMTTKRKMFVDIEATEGEYEKGWAVQAIEKTKGNEQEAKKWLEAHAVKRSEQKV